MDMRRFTAVKGNEEETVRAYPQDRRHRAKLNLEPGPTFNRTQGTTHQRGRLTINIQVCIVRSLNFKKTITILLPFQGLVKDFKRRLLLQKADRIVSLIPLWLTCIIPLWPTRRQADGESVH